MNLPKLLHVLRQFKGANPLFVTTSPLDGSGLGGGGTPSPFLTKGNAESDGVRLGVVGIARFTADGVRVDASRGQLSPIDQGKAPEPDAEGSRGPRFYYIVAQVLP